MSLINEALKKAQRARTAGPPPEPEGAAIGSPVAKRSHNQSVNTLVLIGSGAVVLVVLSVVGTIFLFQRPSEAPAASPSAPVKAAPKPATAAEAMPAPKITHVLPPAPAPAPTEPPAARSEVQVPPAQEAPAPVPVPPPRGGKPAPTTTMVNATPPPAVVPATPPAKPPPPAAAAPGAGRPAASPAPSVTAAPNERIAAFIESVRISGLRAMGAESRVLINDRVYRLNDIVERSLGVRLIKVENDSLTFVDNNGVTYVKYF